MLECKCDLGNVEECDIIWEHILFTQEPKDLTTLNKVKDQIEVCFVLESLNQVNDEWVRDRRKNVFLVLDVVNLFKLNDFLFVEHLEGI